MLLHYRPPYYAFASFVHKRLVGWFCSVQDIAIDCENWLMLPWVIIVLETVYYPLQLPGTSGTPLRNLNQIYSTRVYKKQVHHSFHDASPIPLTKQYTIHKVRKKKKLLRSKTGSLTLYERKEKHSHHSARQIMHCTGLYCVP